MVVVERSESSDVFHGELATLCRSGVRRTSGAGPSRHGGSGEALGQVHERATGGALGAHAPHPLHCGQQEVLVGVRSQSQLGGVQPLMGTEPTRDQSWPHHLCRSWADAGPNLVEADLQVAGPRLKLSPDLGHVFSEPGSSLTDPPAQEWSSRAHTQRIRTHILASLWFDGALPSSPHLAAPG